MNRRLFQAIKTLKPLIFGLFVGLTACQNASIQSSTKSRPYDRNATGIQPEVTLHRSLDANGQPQVDLYLSIERRSLLYSRAHSKAPFVASLSVNLDGQTWALADTAWDDTPRLLRAKWTLERDIASNRATVVVEDVQRKSQWVQSLPWSSLPQLIRQDFLVWSEQDAWPTPNQNVAVGDTLLLAFPPKAQDEVWNVELVNAPSSLPPPPYSNARWALDTLNASPIASLVPGASVVEWIVPWGTTLWRSDNQPVTLLLHGRRTRFPDMVEPPFMIEPLRFIASRSEYKALTEASHPKLAMDQFWLACGKNPDKARMLLQTYYERVEEANHAFSGVLEGWRTDRGVVHVVFGVPDRVRRDRWNEYWIYGEEGTANALTFHFRRRNLPFDDNFFELQRSFQFRSPWDRAISNWRNGRVRGD